ncbi:MAG TPA: NGG1p interacting factor NIF3 [Coriobacteriia bacterium]|jgi:putative NIF3 family GTP cyclohydrolase 1 type 2
MKLRDIYRTCIEAGMEADPRSPEELRRVLDAAKRAYEKLDEDERPFYDVERLTNPYADTRVAAGDLDLEVRGLITGVDMETAEVLLADRLREHGEPIDLIFSHHPEGPGFARLDEVMHMQADIWASRGVGMGAADSLISKRASEVRRKFSPYNHYRAIQSAELLGFASMSCHTPADNSVQRFVQRALDAAAPATLDDVVKVVRSIPEYEYAAKKGYGPELILGHGSHRPGTIAVDMTGGTEGPTDALNRLSAAGVDTLVGMHYSEEHRKRAEDLHMNLVLAGHISSDTLGMNLILDKIESQGVKVICTSGIVRVRRY